MTIAPRAGAAGLAMALALTLASTDTARGGLITNGSFQAGFSNWTRVDALGSDGGFLLQSGSLSPVNGDPVPPPPGGVAAMTDAQGPGSHVLYQDFVVPATPFGPAQLGFDLFLGNRASGFFTPSPATLDFGIAAFNQQARVDILLAGTGAFSVAPADVLLNVFQTRPGDPLVSGYRTIRADLTSLIASHAGQTLRLRFAETDNAASFQMGVTNVDINSVPEPGSLVLVGIGGSLATLAWRRRRPVTGRPRSARRG